MPTVIHDPPDVRRFQLLFVRKQGMCSNTTPSRPERYVIEQGQYVLYAGNVRLLATRAIAVLVDTRLGMLITHGDPASVRRELDEMREILSLSRAPRYDRDWLLLEGHPRLEVLNEALRGNGSVLALKDAFSADTDRSAGELARALIARISRR